jgi:uncharacterized membrane protein YgcG
MKGLITLVLSLCLAAVFVNSVAGAEYDDALTYAHSPEVAEHHRSKRSPYDPIIPALLLGKSAFLLGTILGPKLLHRPVYHHRPHYQRVYHSGGGWGHGGGGGYSSGGGGYSGGSGYSSGWHGW